MTPFLVQEECNKQAHFKEVKIGLVLFYLLQSRLKINSGQLIHQRTTTWDPSITRTETECAICKETEGYNLEGQDFRKTIKHGIGSCFIFVQILVLKSDTLINNSWKRFSQVK
jgi:hypothetical protein